VAAAPGVLDESADLFFGGRADEVDREGEVLERGARTLEIELVGDVKGAADVDLAVLNRYGV